MKVIFTDNVPGVALKDDVKRVRPGFFRNYLQPYRKAVLATEPLLREWDERRKRMLIKKEQLRAKFEETKTRLEGAVLHIEKKVTKKGTLYGGIKAADIVRAILTNLKLEVPEEAVVLPAPIKAVGTYEVKLRLAEGIETNVPIEIVAKALKEG